MSDPRRTVSALMASLITGYFGCYDAAAEMQISLRTDPDQVERANNGLTSTVFAVLELHP